MSLLSGVLWNELKCEFNLLGAKVNFRRGISHALWGVYGTLPLRDAYVGPKPQPQICLANSRRSLIWRSWYTSPYSPAPTPPPFALRPAAGVWSDALLITQALLGNPEAQGCEFRWGLWHTHTPLLQHPHCPSKHPIRQVGRDQFY